MSITERILTSLLDYRNPRENDRDALWFCRRVTAQVPIGLNTLLATIETLFQAILLILMYPLFNHSGKAYSQRVSSFEASLLTVVYGSISFITGIAMRSITIDKTQTPWRLNLDENVGHTPSKIRAGAKELASYLKLNRLGTFDEIQITEKLLAERVPFRGLTYYYKTGSKNPHKELNGTFKAYLTQAMRETQ